MALIIYRECPVCDEELAVDVDEDFITCFSCHAELAINYDVDIVNGRPRSLVNLEVTKVEEEDAS